MNRKDDTRLPRRLRFASGSLMVAIPPQMWHPLGWTNGSWVAVRREGEEIVLSHLHLGNSDQPGDPMRPLPKGKHGQHFKHKPKEETK